MVVAFEQYVVTDSKRFHDNIKKLLPTNISTFELYHFDLSMLKGYGQYQYLLFATINGIDYSLKLHTTDSKSWDYYEGRKTEMYPTRTWERWIKSKVLFILSNESVQNELKEI